MVRIKNVPLSADDAQIRRALSIRQCDIINFYRDKLRIDGRLTNCENGDRIAIVKDLQSPLPSTMEIGRYKAVIRHKGQVNENLKCSKCLQTGHVTRDCVNDIVCRSCKGIGHISSECPQSLHDESTLETTEEAESDQEVSDQNDDDSLCDAPTNKISHIPLRKTKSKKSSTKPSGANIEKSSVNQNKTGTIDKFLTAAKGTPSRKSSNIPQDIRTPPSPTVEIAERGRTSKKPNNAKTKT